jgi:hypothetical protein
MAYFAEVKDGVVGRVIVVHDWAGETEEDVKAFIESLGFDGSWIETFKDRSKRGHFAGTGMFYNESLDCFHYAKPFDSWALDGDGNWSAPTKRPDGYYEWDEESKTWKAQEVN